MMASKTIRRFFVLACLQSLLAGASATAGEPHIKLFDSATLRGWTDAEGKPVTRNWLVEDGMLVSRGGGESIFTAGEYGDFDLSFEWKIGTGGNSGVKYRVAFYEKGVRGRPGWLGCEYQIFGHASQRAPSKYSSGAIYDLYAPSSKGKVRPAGEFNRGRIVVRGTRVEHWLNGVRVVEADASSRDWRRCVAESKFDVVDGFFTNRKGRIELQDHDSKVWFRNIVLRPLDTR